MDYYTKRLLWTSLLPIGVTILYAWAIWPSASTGPAIPPLNSVLLGRDPGMSVYEYTHPVTGKKYLLFWGDNGRLSTQPE